MRLFVAVLLLISTYHSVLGQIGINDFDVIFGKTIDVSAKENHQTIFNLTDYGTFTVSTLGTNNDGFIVNQFDGDLNRIKTKEFNLKYRKYNLRYTGVLEVKNKVYLFTMYTDKKLKTSYLFKHEFNPTKLTISEGKEVFRAHFDEGPKGEEARFQFTISKNSEYIMILSGIPSFKYEKNYFGLMVYTTNFDTVWNKNSIDIGNINENYLEFRTDVSNDGKVIVLARVINQSKRESLGTINYTYRMLVYGKGDEPVIRELKVAEHYIMDTEFDIISDSAIRVFGYYSEKGWGQKGVFTWVLNLDSTQDVPYKEFEFPIEYITQYDTEREKAKALKKDEKGKEVVFEGYQVKELIENSDSSFTLIGEMYQYFVSTHTINSQISYTYHYKYGNIIIAKFNKTGELEWLEQIAKNQHTIDDYGRYSSFFSTQIADKLILVFNDHPLNNYKLPGENIDTWSGVTKYTDVVMYQIELEGKLERTNIFNGMNELVISKPSSSISISNSAFIIVGEGRKLFKLIGVEF